MLWEHIPLNAQIDFRVTGRRTKERTDEEGQIRGMRCALSLFLMYLGQCYHPAVDGRPVLLHRQPNTSRWLQPAPLAAPPAAHTVLSTWNMAAGGFSQRGDLLAVTAMMETSGDDSVLYPVGSCTVVFAVQNSISWSSTSWIIPLNNPLWALIPCYHHLTFWALN